MPRRRGPGRWSEDQFDELGVGRFFDSGRWRRRCTVEAWCPQCSAGWWCGSFFADRDEQEAAYWDLRDRLMADELLTNRPWSWWRYEAASHCRCEPRCGPPDGSRERDDWLGRHDLFTPRERALLAQVAAPVGSEGD